MLVAATALDVALVGSLAALAAAVATPGSALLVAWQTSRATQHARVYEQRLDAYDRAMTLAYQVQAVIVTSVANYESGATATVDRYGTEEILEVAAHLEVRGSAATAEALHDLSNSAIAYVDAIKALAKFPRPAPDDERKKIYDAKDVVVAARKRLGELIRSDLGH
jgi:hypothetical protein